MNKKIQALVDKFKGDLINDEPHLVYQFKTCVGTLIVTFFKNDLEFIPMIFEEDFNLSNFLELTHDETINKHSYKWNLISSDTTFNLERLEQRLELLCK